MRRNLNWPKLATGAGIITSSGGLYYEKRKIERYLDDIVNSNVLYADKKHTDYIYIKYHIYNKSMRNLKLKEKANANWISILINPIEKWWKALKHSIAWRLLKIAQNGDKYERLKAVRQLSQIIRLKDWDFRHLAQMCDARTAISLARSECDSRWFVPIHNVGIVKNPKSVLRDLYKMLENMKPNFCIEHFFKKYQDQYIKEMLHEPDIELLKEIIAFLHHLTKDIKSSEKILDQGGLIILLELKKIFDEDNETLTTLCKVMANISLVKDCHQDFFVTGWVTVLAQLRFHSDLRLQLISTKTLANLDYDDIQIHQYSTNVYPLYPKYRQVRKTIADVILIHGILGGVFFTWRQKDKNKDLFASIYTTQRVKHNQRDKYETTKNKNQKDLKYISVTNSDTHKINDDKKKDNISDSATKELLELFEQSGELDNDWEVVYPDCPIKANCNCVGEFSVSGDKWINDDNNDEYTNCWPMDWLPKNFSNIRILGIDFKSAATKWSATYAKHCPCKNKISYLDNRSNSLLEQLVLCDVGENRPVIWMGHSMGGILTKQIILKSLANDEQKIQQVAQNTKAIIFLGTPHRGSVLSKWKQRIEMLISPSIEVKEMEENNKKLLDIHEKFMHYLQNKFTNLEVITIAEGEPTMLTTFKFPLKIVTEESAFLNYGDFYVLKDNHLSLSKPKFKQTFMYQRLITAIEKSLSTSLDAKPHLQHLNAKRNL